MKTAIATAAFIMAAGTASAADFTLGGQTLSLGAEFDMNYTTGVEEWGLDMTPELGWSAYSLDFTVGTTIDILELDQGTDNLFQGLDFTAEYDITNQLGMYAKVGTDADLNFGDVTMGVTFAF